MSRNKAAEPKIDIDIGGDVSDGTLVEILTAQYSHRSVADVRAALEQTGEQVWTNEELLADFEVEFFHPPYVTVIRKADGIRGTVAFIDSPRLYFHFFPGHSHDATNPKKYDTGAVRSGDCEDTRYDLISPIGLAALARTYAEGASKFGAFNWENGMPVTDLLNHAIAHIYKFLSGDRSEDHLAHAAWNLLGSIHSLEVWPEINNGYLRGPGCTCPPVADESIPAAAGFEQVAPGIYATASSGVAGTAKAASSAQSIADSLDTLRKAVLAAETAKNTTDKPA